MRISDWSSDVCSSDLLRFSRCKSSSKRWKPKAKCQTPDSVGRDAHCRQHLEQRDDAITGWIVECPRCQRCVRNRLQLSTARISLQIGRATCRERVWHYV